MVLPLRYGDPPELKECTDVGSIKVPTYITNSSDQHGNQIGLYEMYGDKLPDWAVARHAIVVLREYGMPVTVKIENFGRIVYAPEGWEVVERY